MKAVSYCLKLIWKTVCFLVITVMVLIVCGCGLWIYGQNSQAPQLVQVFSQEVSSIVNGESSVSLEDGIDTIKHLATDTVNTADHGRWQSNQARIFIETQEPTLRAAYETAIMNWNRTGAFEFIIVEDSSQADIIASDMNDGQTQAAGVADSKTNVLTNYYTSVVLKLNAFYLLDPQYGYDMQRIIHTAEHELGHAIGLGHEDSQPSVMESAGSYNGIQQSDIEAVLQLYGIG